MKTYRLLLLVLLLQLILGSVAYAGNVDVRFGVYQNYPLVFTDDRGHAKGIFIDVLERVAAKEGWTVEYVPGDWADLLDQLENGEIDLIGAIAYSEARSALFDFSAESVITNWGQIYTRSNANITSILDLEGKTVAVLRGDIHAEAVRNLLQKFGITIDLKQAESYPAILDALEMGESDAGVMNRLAAIKYAATYNVRETGIIFNPVEIHYASTKGVHQDLLGALDANLQTMKADHSSAYYQAIDRWFGSMRGKQVPKWVLWAASSLAGLLLIFTLSTVILRFQVRARTRHLQAEINERKQTELKLQMEREKLTAILESMEDGVYIVNKDYDIQYVNPALQEEFGLPEGKKCHKYFHDSDEPCTFCKNEDVFAGKTVHWEWTSPKNGKTYDLIDTPLKNADGSVFKLEIFRDITKRVRAEKEKLLLEAQLRQGQKLESIGTLASGVAHEINNPLTGMINYADLIEERVKDDELRKFAQGIMKEGNRVAEIVKSLLSFAPQEKQSHSPARMEDIIDASLMLVGAALRKDQITIEKEIPQDLPKVRCRSQQIEQVIINLLTNARDALNQRYEGYDENKVVKIVVERFEKDGVQWIRTTIEDHGAGISEDVIDRIFDPFYTTKRPDKGTGLGLSVSHGIIKEHHGELLVESKLGEYTKFHIDLRVNNGWSL